MANKQKKNQKIEIIIGIVVLVLLFFGVLKIDDKGNISFAGNGEFVEEKNINDTNVEDSKEGLNANELQPSASVEGELLVYYFDVGQADSIFVYNDGESMLIDAGNNPDGKLICNYLNTLGITKIDYLIGTHPHEDHIGGLDNVIKSFDIGTIYMPKQSANTKTFEDVINATSDKKLKIKSPNIGSTFNIGDAVCEVMSKRDEAEDANTTSICVKLTYGSKSFLFTGDMETENEKERSWDDIDVLKVAHHGSSSSTSKNFLNQTKPEIAIISCGPNNDYGHPHKEVLTRLEKFETEVYRTDLLGTILLKCDGENVEIEQLELCLDGNER